MKAGWGFKISLKRLGYRLLTNRLFVVDIYTDKGVIKWSQGLVAAIS